MNTPHFSLPIAITLLLANASIFGQILELDLGSFTLEANQSDQVRDFYIQNRGATAVDAVFGLNFALQVADGSSGPVVQAASLSAGDSIFSSSGANLVNQGSSARILFFGIDADGSSVSLPPVSSTLVARVTFDTTGLAAGSGPWTVSANHVGPLNSSTTYVLVGGDSRIIDSFGSGTITVVPEPAAGRVVLGALLISFMALRRACSRPNFRLETNRRSLRRKVRLV